MKIKVKWVTKKCENKYKNKNKNIQNMYAENNRLRSVLQYN